MRPVKAGLFALSAVNHRVRGVNTSGCRPEYDGKDSRRGDASSLLDVGVGGGRAGVDTASMDKLNLPLACSVMADPSDCVLLRVGDSWLPPLLLRFSTFWGSAERDGDTAPSSPPLLLPEDDLPCTVRPGDVGPSKRARTLSVDLPGLIGVPGP